MKMSELTHEWVCDGCNGKFVEVYADLDTEHPISLDTGYPYYNIIGWYCKECFKVADEELQEEKRVEKEANERDTSYDFDDD